MSLAATAASAPNSVRDVADLPCATNEGDKRIVVPKVGSGVDDGAYGVWETHRAAPSNRRSRQSR